MVTGCWIPRSRWLRGFQIFRRQTVKTKSGFTLVEVMMVTLLFSIIVAAGSMVFISSGSIWSVMGANIRMQENLRRMMQRVSAELQESGTNSAGVFQVVVSDNTGLNSSDILRFSIPICPCGVQPMDITGNVYAWGAPLKWGQSGCSENYTVGSNGKVDICHLPPGNPNNAHTLNVSENAVKSHLAHGDWIGDCDLCDPENYENRFIEYRIAAGNRLMRRVLRTNLSLISEDVLVDSVADFQVAVTGQTMVRLSVDLAQTASQNREVTLTDSVDVFLRN